MQPLIHANPVSVPTHHQCVDLEDDDADAGTAQRAYAEPGTRSAWVHNPLPLQSTFIFQVGHLRIPVVLPKSLETALVSAICTFSHRQESTIPRTPTQKCLPAPRPCAQVYDDKNVAHDVFCAPTDDPSVVERTIAAAVACRPGAPLSDEVQTVSTPRVAGLQLTPPPLPLLHFP